MYAWFALYPSKIWPIRYPSFVVWLPFIWNMEHVTWMLLCMHYIAQGVETLKVRQFHNLVIIMIYLDLDIQIWVGCDYFPIFQQIVSNFFLKNSLSVCLSLCLSLSLQQELVGSASFAANPQIKHAKLDNFLQGLPISSYCVSCYRMSIVFCNVSSIY